MSLRVKLTWAFLIVALVALVPALVITNAGFHMDAMRQGRRMMGGPMMHLGGPGPGADAPAQEYVDLAMRWSMVAGAAALVLAAATGFWTAGRITRNLRSLRDAAHHLDLRDLSRRVPVAGQDEIGELAASFNVMCDRLEAEERSRRQLLADVAHELRHPLAVLQGRLELMQEGRAPIDQEALLPLQDEVIRLSRLVGDLRDLSLAEVGALSLHLTRLDLKDVLESLYVNMEPVAADKGVQLTLQVDPALPAVEGDPDRMRQVLVNILANALHHTPASGRVAVGARRVGNAVHVHVRDTGPGISPEDLKQIFDRFYRADQSRSRSTGGSGLGLAIVRSLVEMHRGRVTAQSKVGAGTEITIILPAAL